MVELSRTQAARRLRAAWIVIALPLLMGASARSTNFVVEAPSDQIAERIAQYAEHYRKRLAQAWLGQPLPDWDKPCRVRVKVTGGEAGGMTTFSFSRGRVADQEMMVEGSLERIVASALPHEITHTVFAAYFGGPLPRWADEGASLLSEDRRERQRHERFAARLLDEGRGWALPVLFQIDDYPKDLIGFYGQGYSVSRFLVEIGGRPRFLKFLKDGMEHDWDAATRRHYGFANAEELDRAWRSWHTVVVRNERRAPAQPGQPVSRASEAAVVRAQSPDDVRRR